MYQKNFSAWPEGLMHDVPLATQTVYDNLEKSFQKNPNKTALVFYETQITYSELYDSVNRLAAWLYHDAGIRKGNRVAIFAQNCPQYVMAYYAILCAGAVVVPINPMSLPSELSYLLENSGAKAIFAASELKAAFEPVLSDMGISGVEILYNDYLRIDTDLEIPDVIRGADLHNESSLLCKWQVAVCEERSFPEPVRSLDDLIMLPYTSGSTGNPKGCMHNNLTTQHGMRSVYDWFGLQEQDVFLVVAPMFHVVGMQGGVNSAIAVGGTAVILPRWDRKVAAQIIHKFRVTAWPAVPSMIIDLINLPGLSKHDVASLRISFGGGSSMPEAVANQLKALCDVTFLEGYGMTETCCPTTANPMDAPRTQCAGVPVFNTHIRIVDPDSLAEVESKKIGEVLISGPQVLTNYWENEDANTESFVEMDGLRYLRRGDLGYLDEKGYLYVVDRIKRMINASGFKVWPTQVEATMHKHPAIEEVCVFGANDPKRGETVKAMVVLSPEYANTTEDAIIEWSRENMAAYKIPRSIIFVDVLPKSGSGKVLWREIQDDHNRQLAKT